MQDMAAKGRGKTSRGEMNKNAKLKAADVLMIFQLGRSGLRPVDIAPRFGIGPGCVEDIFKKRTWAWLTEQFPAYDVVLEQ